MLFQIGGVRFLSFSRQNPLMLLAFPYSCRRRFVLALDRSKVLQQAQLLASRGQYENAVAEWRKLAAEAPYDGSIHNSIGDLHLKRNATLEATAAFFQAAAAFKSEGATLKAIAAYKKVLKCDPTKYEVYRHLGDLNAERGLVSTAVQDYLTLAKHYLKERKPKEALDLYQRIVAIDPSNLNAQQRIAELCLQDNRQDEATKVYLELGRERSSQGRYAEAKEAYLAVLAIDPTNKEAQQFVEGVKGAKSVLVASPHPKGAASAHQPSELFSSLAEAVRRMDEGQYDGAEAILNQMLSREPGNTQVCQLLARLHLQRGDLQVAVGEYRFLAGGALRAQDFLLAESLIGEFLSAQPDSVPMLELYGELYEERKDPAAAAVQYARAVELLLAHPEPGMEGHHEELFEKVRSLSPDAGLIERLAEKLKEAAAQASPAAGQDGAGTVMREEAASPLTGTGATAAVAEGDGMSGAGAQAIQEKSHGVHAPVLGASAADVAVDHEAHFALGVAYKNMGLYAEAREEFEISRIGGAFYLDSCLMAALCFKEEGKLDQAVRTLEAVSADPRCHGDKGQVIRYELGLLYEAAAQWTKAAATFQLISSFHDASQRLAALKDKPQPSVGIFRFVNEPAFPSLRDPLTSDRRSSI